MSMVKQTKKILSKYKKYWPVLELKEKINAFKEEANLKDFYHHGEKHSLYQKGLKAPNQKSQLQIYWI